MAKIRRPYRRPTKSKKFYGKISQQTSNRPFQRTNNRSFQRTNNRSFQRTNNRSFQRTNNRSFQRTSNRPFQRTSNRPFQRISNRPFQRISNRPFRRTNNRGFRRTQNRGFQRAKTPSRARQSKKFIKAQHNKPLKLNKLAKHYRSLIKSIKLTKAYKLIKFREAFRANELSSQFYVRTKFYKKNRLRRLTNLYIKFKKLTRTKLPKLIQLKLNRLLNLRRWHALISKPMQLRNKQNAVNDPLNLYKLLRLYKPYSNLLKRGKLLKLNAKKRRLKSQLLKLRITEPVRYKRTSTVVAKSLIYSLKTLHTKNNQNIIKSNAKLASLPELVRLYTNEKFLLKTVKTPPSVTLPPLKRKSTVVNNTPSIKVNEPSIRANKPASSAANDKFTNELNEVRKMLAFERP